ncbi:hypothetical protein IPL85_00890 [Candidatus Saccharibacteria bacterium]|nr:MAG: hypothetical protein IPL85_00890 [Candidatus Saccharibacteria bacterium]
MNKFITVKSFVAAALVAGTLGMSVFPSQNVSATQLPTDASCSAANDGGNYVNGPFKIRWASMNEVHIQAKADVVPGTKLYFSSYTMPDTWSQDTKVFDETAVPQDIYGVSDSVIFNKEGDCKVLKVQLPDPCKNVQVDVYYGPEIKHLDKTVQYGHKDQYVDHQFIKKQGTCAGQGEAQVSGTSTKVPAELPAELPATGASNMALFAGVLGVLTYITSLCLQAKKLEK